MHRRLYHRPYSSATRTLVHRCAEVAFVLRFMVVPKRIAADGMEFQGSRGSRRRICDRGWGAIRMTDLRGSSVDAGGMPSGDHDFTLAYAVGREPDGDTMAASPVQRNGYRLRCHRRRGLAKLAPPKLSAERRPGPSARPHGRATGQGRHGRADARSAESTRHRDRGEELESLPRKGRAAWHARRRSPWRMAAGTYSGKDPF